MPLRIQEEDERSTEVGSSSDTEVSSAGEETPKVRPSKASCSLMEGDQLEGRLQQLLRLLGCPRRSTVPRVAEPPRPAMPFESAAAKQLQGAELCPRCSCKAQCCVPQKVAAMPGVGVLPPLFFPPGFGPPPGLPPPPGLELLMRQHGVIDSFSSPVHEEEAASRKQFAPFNPVTFRRELVVILRDLAADRNSGRAVRRVREQQVPMESHASEFSDILTRALETRNGMARRSMIAFAVGLVAGQPSAFDRARCLEGLELFFLDVYEELRSEVPKLSTLVGAELLPTMRLALPAGQILARVPDNLHAELKLKSRSQR